MRFQINKKTAFGYISHARNDGSTSLARLHHNLICMYRTKETTSGLLNSVFSFRPRSHSNCSQRNIRKYGAVVVCLLSAAGHREDNAVKRLSANEQMSSLFQCGHDVPYQPSHARFTVTSDEVTSLTCSVNCRCEVPRRGVPLFFSGFTEKC